MGGLLWLLGAALAAPKDPFSEPDESELFRAESELITVASRFAQTVRQAPSIVRVLSAGDIRRAGHRTLADVLRSVPGVYVTVAKEARHLAWFRGVSSSDNNKILLLVDGVPWYDGVYTHAWIDEYIPLDHVRQIEIIKGPGSALYGSNAFAGVVNVVTWDGRSLDGARLRGMVGSDGRAGLSAIQGERLLVRGHTVDARAYVRAIDADGDGLDLVPRGRDNVNGFDPRRSLNAGLRMKIDALTLSVDVVDYRHSYFVNEQDDALDILLADPDDFALRYRNAFLNLGWEVDLGALGKVEPYLYSQRHDNPGNYAWFNDAQVDGSTAAWDTTLVETEKDSARHGVGLIATLLPAPSHATVAGIGAEGTHIRHLEDIQYDDRSHDPVSPSTFQATPGWISNAFAFAQHTWTTSWWLELTGGARLDYHSYFGPFFSPRLGGLLIPGDAVLIKLLYGRAFRAPNARELLVEVGKDDDGLNLFTNGNPGLDPEVIDTLELELTVSPDPDLDLRLSGFASGIDQEIVKVEDDDPELGNEFYANGGSTLAVGAEAELNLRRGPFDMDLSYSWTRAVDRMTGFPVYEFPPHMAGARLGLRPVEPVTFTLLGEAVGPRPRIDWAPDSGLGDGPAYALLHGGVVVDGMMKGRASLDLSVRNLLDSPYATLVPKEDANALNSDGTAKYPVDLEGPGRTVFVQVEVKL